MLLSGGGAASCRKEPGVRTARCTQTLEFRRETSQFARPPLNISARARSKADIRARIKNVRFTPESGHTAGCIKCPLSAKSGHGLRSHLNGWRVGRSHPNAATSIEAHHPDLLSQHGPVLGEQATAGKAATTASDRQHEDRQVSILDGLARGKSEASPSSHRAL